MYKCLLLFLFVSISVFSQNKFVKTNGISFLLNQKKYEYIGCNYWYGGYLWNDKKNNGKQRLQNELDFLQNNNVTNLRVFISSEGDNSYAYRVFPSIQPTQNVYNEQLLKGFDYFLQQAKKRNMKVVFVLNNNWEWSGGFGQYLEWNGAGKPPLPKTPNWDWDEYCKYIAQFYTSQKCMKANEQFIKKILTRKNTFTHQYYFNDETIMAWELSNEPRPMLESAKNDYYNWIKNTASYIKKIDKNHLVTIGVEGIISTRNDDDLFIKIHDLPTVNYATIHLWPKTWQWYNGESNQSNADSTLAKTKNYIIHHVDLLKKINKPLVIEEFGLHRDGNLFTAKATVNNRNTYYETIFEVGAKNNIAGYNFWGFAGVEKNTNEKLFMQKGMPYSADPPQEEQGLYSVFMTDSSTWNVLKKWIK